MAAKRLLRNITYIRGEDKNGCPIIYYGRQYGVYIGWAYSPLVVAEEAIKLYDLAKSDPSARKNSLTV